MALELEKNSCLIIDKEKSDPLGINENGEIIYDTVANVFNKFEELYFPVKQESRYETATIIFPISGILIEPSELIKKSSI